MKLLECTGYADEIKQMVKTFVDSYDGNEEISLTVFSNPDDPASQVYLRNKRRICDECGIKFIDIPTTETVDVMDYVNKLYQELASPWIVQLPCNRIGDAIIKQCNRSLLSTFDADGINQTSLGLLLSCKDYKQLSRDKVLLPCTPLGILYVIKKHFGNNLSGKKVVVINRSDLVGKPIAKMLMDENCTVTICHSKSGDDVIKAYCSEADIIITAVGKAKYFNSSFLKPLEYQNSKTLVLDVGINRYDNKLCGDVDVEEMLDKTSDYVTVTKVPKGIGVMTTAMLAHNVCVNLGMTPWFNQE